MMLQAPFAGTPAEVFKTEHRFNGLQWLGRARRVAFVRDYDRDTPLGADAAPRG